MRGAACVLIVAACDASTPSSSTTSAGVAADASTDAGSSSAPTETDASTTRDSGSDAAVECGHGAWVVDGGHAAWTDGGLYPDGVTKIVITAKGGFPPPPSAGSTCTPSDDTYTLVLPARELSWQVCQWSCETRAFAFVTGEKTIALADYTDLDGALHALTRTSRSPIAARTSPQRRSRSRRRPATSRTTTTSTSATPSAIRERSGSRGSTPSWTSSASSRSDDPLFFPAMPLQAVIETKLREALAPSHLEVINESYMHSSGKNNPAAETHFKVVVVSQKFEGLNAVKRHQLVYGALGDELRMKKGIHALAITSRTPSEWNVNPEANQSPECAGGGK